MTARTEISVDVTPSNALAYEADVLALKYAQKLYGADKEAWEVLAARGPGERPALPRVGGFTFHDSQGLLGCRAVLFVGVPRLRRFGYEQIREFGRRVLEAIASAAADARHVAMTIHGPGYGLDEREAFESQLAGVMDAVASGDRPPALERVTFVERNPGRAKRLSVVLDAALPGRSLTPNPAMRRAMADETRQRLRSVGYTSAAKPHVFVAMPFAEEMDDVYHYGIQGAAHAAGFLCERIDAATFTGDIMERIKNRIESASLVVADLTTSNPNVYLEVGYAWGRGTPTVLVIRDINELRFDVKGHRCLEYKSIKGLEEALSKELRQLRPHTDSEQGPPSTP